MSAEQIQEFRNGIAGFEHNGATFNTLITNFENGVNNIPGNLRTQRLNNARFKAQILREFRKFLNENIKDYIEHGGVMGGNFKAALEEMAAGAVADHQANNAIELWDTHFDPLVDIYESVVEIIDEYYNTEWPMNNNGNNGNNRNSIANNENPGAPAAAGPNAHGHVADPVPANHNGPAPAAGGRRSIRKSRRNRMNRMNRKSRRNNSRRSKRNARR